MSDTSSHSVDRLILGCGYLGLRVAQKWVEQGLSVAATTRSIQKSEQLKKMGLQPILCDLMKRESLAHLPESKILLHAVAVDRHSRESMRALYIDGTRNLLDAVDQRCERIFYISSTSVYGHSAGETITEESECEPVRENGQICLEAEKIVRESGTDSVVFRLAGIYGPGRLIARIDQAKRSLPVPGNPDAWLNLVHVEDCVAAIDAAGKTDLKNETILVSDDLPVRRREYYQLLAKLLQTAPPVFDATRKDPKGERGDGKRCDNSKLHQLLLSNLRYPSIKEGLPEAIAQDA